jgi:transcriptional regulator of acetoin/glycerol metabolism
VDLDRPLREVVDTATRLVEKNYLMRLLAACGGHVIAASKRASIDRRNLYRKLRDYEIDPDTFRQGRGSKR